MASSSTEGNQMAVPEHSASNGVAVGLPPEVREQLAELGATRHYPRGTALVRHGDQDRHVLLLQAGRAKVVATSQDGRLTLLATRVPGDLIGELSFLDNRPRSATVIADVDTVAKVIPPARLTTFLEQRPQATLALSSAIVGKLRWATRRRIDFVVPVQMRLARVLHDLARHYGRRQQSGILIESLSQHDLAGLVGASEPAAQKAFRALRELDVVRTGHRKITIPDLGHLATVADVDGAPAQA